MMEDARTSQDSQEKVEFEIADLPESCCKKIHEFEQELNKQGFWNIALVAYQMENLRG